MNAVNQVFKCRICGNMVEMVHAGQGTLVCCGEDMELLVSKTMEIGNEKHLPVIEFTPEGVNVKVGSVAHPMEDKHYIEWIELIADGKAYRQYLKPGDIPAASFCVKAEQVQAREYCNLHGMWQQDSKKA